MEEIKRLIEAQGKAFEEFKHQNEARIKALEAGKTDPLIKDQMDRIAADMAKMETMKAQVDAIEKAVAKMELEGKQAEADKPVYNSVGEQLLDVIAAANVDRESPKYRAATERLLKVQAAASGANESVGAEGGFLVQTDFAGMLDQGTIATGLLSGMCFNIPVGGTANGVKANLIDETSRATGSRFGGLQTYWAAEAATVTASKPKFRQIELSLKKLFGLMYATEELLADASALTAMVNRWFPAEFGFKVDDAIINGTGAGMPLGILNSGCLVSVAKEAGQAAATILFENIVKMYARLLDSSDPRAIWLINRDILPQLLTMSLAVGTGGIPVFMPANGAADRPFMTLMGKRLMPIEQAATLGTVGDIMLVDLGEYLLATKGGVQAAASIHVKFIYDEMTFRWTYRIDGQPLRSSALTPYKGTANTRSPFIALATRA